MYNVLDISKLIIDYSNIYGYGITNLKLQKLLYFVQVYFLIKKDKPCFTEKLLAKDFGPIVPIAYEVYKSFGNYDICLIENNISNFINKEDKHLILAVVDFFADYMPTELLDIISKQKPFKDAYLCYGEITVDALKTYFTSEEE